MEIYIVMVDPEPFEDPTDAIVHAGTDRLEALKEAAKYDDAEMTIVQNTE